MREAKEKKGSAASVLMSHVGENHFSQFWRTAPQRNQSPKYKCMNCGREWHTTGSCRGRDATGRRPPPPPR